MLKLTVSTRLYISAILIFDSLSATLSSSIFSNAATGVEKEFHIGAEVGTLGTSLFVVGYAFGPSKPIYCSHINLLQSLQNPIAFARHTYVFEGY